MKIINKERIKLSEITIQNLRTVKDAIKFHGGILNVAITKSMISSVKEAHRRKKEEDELKKEKEEEENKRKKKEEHDSLLLKEKQKETDSKEKELLILEKQLDNRLTLNQELIQEAGKQLKIYHSEKNWKEAEKAVEAIENANKAIFELNGRISSMRCELNALSASKSSALKRSSNDKISAVSFESKKKNMIFWDIIFT